MSKVEYHRLFPELPSRSEMLPVALVWMLEEMQKRGSYHTDDLTTYLAERFHADTTLKTPISKRPAFAVYVTRLTGELTERGLHRGERKVYALTPVGKAKAEYYAARFRSTRT